MTGKPLSWLGIVRLGLVQSALGSIIFLTTSTMNRVMVVELMLPAMLPGALVAFHYAVEMLRPRWGHGSDQSGRRAPWIVGGMIVLAIGGICASLATAWMSTNTAAGIALAVLAFFLIGVGAGAGGTNLLALLATKVAPARRPAAAMITFVMMIVGFIITGISVGNVLDPYSPERLVTVTSCVAIAAIAVTLLAVWRVETEGTGTVSAPQSATDETPKTPFLKALSEVWQETQARRFTIFVFVSMLAFIAQDLILEPFAGLVFNMTPGETTLLSGQYQNTGALIGMVSVGILGNRFGGLHLWTIGGCLASAGALFCLALGGLVGPTWPLEANVFLLGLSNGSFAVAAIGQMMKRAGEGQKSREGIRMGLWGAAQAISFGIGGFLAAAAVDLLRPVFADPGPAYALVFTGEALLFLTSAVLAAWVGWSGSTRQALSDRTGAQVYVTARGSPT